MKTLVCHKSPVSLPAHAFAAHKLERICLSKRRLTRAALSPAQQLRREWASRGAAPVSALVHETETVTVRRPFAALSSIALMVAMVLLAAWQTGALHALHR